MKENKSISMGSLLDRTGSVYKLVILASKRALELNEGSPKLVETASKKVATIALEEVRDGKISIKVKKNKG